MIKRPVIFLLALLAALPVFAQVDTRETVVWFINDFPPTYILSGPDRGKGSGDQRMQILIKRLPQFRHEIVEGSVTRMLESMKNKPNVCYAAILKTPERETFIEYSAPYLHILPIGVVTTRSRLPRLSWFINEHDEIRINDLTESGKYQLGIMSGRSFGPTIDHMLKNKIRQESFVFVPASDNLLSRLFKLSSQDEFDGAVGYATEMTYLVRQNGFSKDDFIFLPIAEDPPLVPSFVGCSKTEAGRRIIAAIDRLLADTEVQREANDAYRAWLNKETAARFDRLIKEQHFGKH